VAQLGSALDWGSRGRRFKSCQPDWELGVLGIDVPHDVPQKWFGEVLVGSFDELWSQVAGASAKEKGDRFEELSKWFLENDPVYKHLFTAVYKWRE
jgi:hypothetical protein